jgi:hypothetical protein
MNTLVKTSCTLLFLATLIMPTSAVLSPPKHGAPLIVGNEDFDPLVETITVTVTIHEIRALKTIDLFFDPDLYLKVTINDKEFISNPWQNTKYIENATWSASSEVPKNVELVNITIALWDKNMFVDHLCDISPADKENNPQASIAKLTYSIATGIWWGDDHLGDSSGYGRLNGCDDGSIYEEDRDCELWFDITQTDYDNDGLPYWLETNLYNTSPLVDNRGEDLDNDGVPIEWEHTFGLTYYDWGYDKGYYLIYHPLFWENHSYLDDDEDGLTNIEEHKTWQWGSDPFRKDIFVEIDQMEKGSNGEGSTVPVGSFDLIRDSHAKHNIVWHIDDGRLGGGGLVPFKDTLNNTDLSNYYWTYFMNQDEHYWRRGVFHWGIIAYNFTFAPGFCFSSHINNSSATDCFFLSTVYHDSRVKHFPLLDSLIRKTFDSEKQRALIYAGAIMHEVGHSLAIWNRGVDNRNSYWPWQTGFWRYAPYKSVMNYRYIYTDLADYSDGSRGKNDFNDWGTMDLTHFNPRTQVKPES